MHTTTAFRCRTILSRGAATCTHITVVGCRNLHSTWCRNLHSKQLLDAETCIPGGAATCTHFNKNWMQNSAFLVVQKSALTSTQLLQHNSAFIKCAFFLNHLSKYNSNDLKFEFFCIKDFLANYSNNSSSYDQSYCTSCIDNASFFGKIVFPFLTLKFVSVNSQF